MNKQEMSEALLTLSRFALESIIALNFDEKTQEDIVEEWEDMDFYLASPDQNDPSVDVHEDDADIWEEVGD